jgi:2-keto-4-pentenoate hydratase/2-oxohepta-3-ene-1,7-dioic acid hydratase in catechol pathway
MIFSCAEIVSYTSRFMTLKPGDMIFTGTPEGVISGKPEGERHWLKAGDEVTTSIGRLGKLTVTLTERT